MKDRNRFELTGMSREGTGGAPDRPMKLGGWERYESNTRLADGIVWVDAISDPLSADSHPLLHGRQQMLGSFLAIDGRDSDDRALSFVRDYGLPELCADHGQPSGHVRPPRPGMLWANPDHDELSVVWDELGLCPQHHLRHPGYEWAYGVSVRAMATWASRFHSALRLGAALHGGNPPEASDITNVAEPGEDWAATPSAAAYVLTIFIDHLLQDCRVHPEFRWSAGYEPHGPTFELTPIDSFGAVVVQLVLMIVKADGFATCAACGMPFIPNRQPVAGRRSWCSEAACRRSRGRTISREWQRSKRQRDRERREEQNMRGNLVIREST